MRNRRVLLRQIEAAITKPLTEAGFELTNKALLPVRGSFTIDFSRDNLELACWYDRPKTTLIAEALNGNGSHTQIAQIPVGCRKERCQVLEWIAEFTKAVADWCQQTAADKE